MSAVSRPKAPAALAIRQSMTGPVVILCPTAWSLRNVLLSGLHAALRESQVDVRILSTPRANSALAEGWQGPEAVEMVSGGSRRMSAAAAVINLLVNASFARRHALTTYGIFRAWRGRDESPARRARHATVRVLAVLGCREPFFSWQVRAQERFRHALPERRAVEDHLRALRPALLVSTSCVVRDEVHYIGAAHALGIPTLGCILSFDNLTSKGVLPVFDHYAVWSQRMRQEVLRLYPDRQPARVHVTGTPQFDFHRSEEFRLTRDETLRRLGLGPGDRYVLYAANCAAYTPTEPDLVAAFAARLHAVPGLREHHVVVRPHPGDDPARWALDGTPGGRVVMSWPRSAEGRFATQEAQVRLVSSLAHADACINMASTMSLDAAVVDTPVICIAFAADPSSRESRLAADCYRTTHYAPIAASGGVRLARSMDELLGECAAAAADRGRLAAERAALVADVCGPVGGAARRLAAVISRITAEVA